MNLNNFEKVDSFHIHVTIHIHHTYFYVLSVYPVNILLHHNLSVSQCRCTLKMLLKWSICYS